MPPDRPSEPPWPASRPRGVRAVRTRRADGTDAVYFVAQENYPVEFLEVGYPVRLRTYGILTDSCGAGRWRGGCGIVREYDILAEEAMLAVRIDSVKNPPWGMAGGMSGGVGRARPAQHGDAERQRATATRTGGHRTQWSRDRSRPSTWCAASTRSPRRISCIGRPRA